MQNKDLYSKCGNHKISYRPHTDKNRPWILVSWIHDINRNEISFHARTQEEAIQTASRNGKVFKVKS